MFCLAEQDEMLKKYSKLNLERWIGTLAAVVLLCAKSLVFYSLEMAQCGSAGEAS